MDVDGESIVLELNSVDQLFNAFDADPFSELEGAALGEAGLERLVTRLQLTPLRKPVDLIICLPAAEVPPGLAERLDGALDRYCQARIEENNLQVQLGRRQHTIGMVVVTVLVLAVMLIAYLLFTTVWAGASDLVKTLIAASISVFAWVILWDPLEALLFDWAGQARENRALAHIMEMRVVVQNQS